MYFNKGLGLGTQSSFFLNSMSQHRHCSALHALLIREVTFVDGNNLAKVNSDPHSYDIS